MNKHKRGIITKTHNISVNFLKRWILLCVYLILTACGSTSEETDYNVFRSIFSCEEEKISLREVSFFMTSQEVIKAKGLTEAESGDRITNNISLEGISDNVIEMFTFEEDKLVSVRYIISVEQTAVKETIQTINDQAEAYMPEKLLRGEQGILQEEPTYWDDEESMVYVEFPVSESGQKIIIITASSLVDKKDTLR